MIHKDDWEIVFQWGLIALEKIESNWFERAVRPPWVRLILKNSKWEILVTREHRHEHDSFDYRIPGWKVFDDLASYLAVRENKEALEEWVIAAAKLEAKEEAWIDEISDIEISHISKAWATVDWTLYYVSGTITKQWEQTLTGDEWEHWVEVLFYSSEELLKLMKSWLMLEERSVGVLLKYV